MNQIFQCGDCLELMQDIPEHSIDMILTDPPYGVTSRCKWDIPVPFDQMWDAFHRVAKPDAAIVIFGCEPFASLLRVSNLKEFKYDWVWDKVTGTGFFNAKKQPMRNHEMISVFYGKQCTYHPQMTHGHVRKTAVRAKENSSEIYSPHTAETSYNSTDRYPRSIQVFSKGNRLTAIHPTQKPLALVEYLVRTYTNEGDCVLDPFADSMTTALACLASGRKSICIEKDEDIFSKGVGRYREFSGEQGDM